MDYLRLVEPVDRFGQDVLVTVALAEYRGLDMSFGQSLATQNRGIVSLLNQSSSHLEDTRATVRR